METEPEALIGKSVNDRAGAEWQITAVGPLADVHGSGNVWNATDEEVTAVTVARGEEDPLVLQVPTAPETLVSLEWEEAKQLIASALPEDRA